MEGGAIMCGRWRQQAASILYLNVFYQGLTLSREQCKKHQEAANDDMFLQHCANSTWVFFLCFFATRFFSWGAAGCVTVSCDAVF